MVPAGCAWPTVPARTTSGSSSTAHAVRSVACGPGPWAPTTWRLPVEGIDLSARLSVYNLFNNQKTINVHQRYEAQPGQ